MISSIWHVTAWEAGDSNADPSNSYLPMPLTFDLWLISQQYPQEWLLTETILSCCLGSFKLFIVVISSLSYSASRLENGSGYHPRDWKALRFSLSSFKPKQLSWKEIGSRGFSFGLNPPFDSMSIFCFYPELFKRFVLRPRSELNSFPTLQLYCEVPHELSIPLGVRAITNDSNQIFC